MTRRRSLNKDDKDFNQLRHHRDAHMGFSVSTEFYQPVPFFYTREGSNLNLIGHYRGDSIFIICNGPSLVSGNYDLSLLKRPGVMTYGMNNGPRTIRPNFWSCVDDPKRFLKSIWLDPCITKFVPHAHAEKKIFDNEKWQDSEILVGQCPNVIYFHRNEKFMADRFLFEDTINWGNSGDNGGGRSVMLPIIRICFLLGFRTIYLLGADFKMSANYTYHFDEQRAKGAVNCNLGTYDKLKSEYLPELQPFLEDEGVSVFNCNPDSELKIFPMISFEQAIANATSKLGDVDHERTWGMYSKPEERQKWKEEPDNAMKTHLAYSRAANEAPIHAVHNVVGNADEDVMEDPDEVRPAVKPVKPALPVKTQAKVVNQPIAKQPTFTMPPPFRKTAEQFKEVEARPKELTNKFNPAQKAVVPCQTPIANPINPVNTVKTVPTKDGGAGGSRRIIRALPCGMITDGSSGNPSSKNVTIEDDGN